MKAKFTLALWFIFISISAVMAQKDTVFAGGTNLTRMVILPNSTLYINGILEANIPNESINIHNGGVIYVKGNLISNQKGLFYSSSNAVSSGKIDTVEIKSSAQLSPVAR